jgi:hypothetical protein
VIFAFTLRAFESATEQQAINLAGALHTALLELHGTTRQLKEYDANMGMTPIEIAQNYAKTDNEIAWLEDVRRRLLADIGVAQASPIRVAI